MKNKKRRNNLIMFLRREKTEGGEIGSNTELLKMYDGCLVFNN